MASEFLNRGYHIASGGTDNHLMLIDLRSKNISGKDAENALIKADITVNKNMVPFDDKPPSTTSGIRIGTAAITTRGLSENDCRDVVAMIDGVLSNANNDDKLTAYKREVHEFMSRFPLYKNEF